MTEKQIRLSKKCAGADAAACVTFHQRVIPLSKCQARNLKTAMKFCFNSKCVAYGRMVYTPATRCVLCRCDLKPPRMLSETVDDSSVKPEWPSPAEMATHPPAANRRSSMRHSA